MSLMQIALAAALVIFMIARRFAGQPLGSRSLTLPAVMIGWGVVQLASVRISAGVLALVGAELVLGLGTGVLRGLTIKIYTGPDGQPWQRYRVATLGVWVAAIAIRVGLAAGAAVLGVHLSSAGPLLVAFGASFVAEALVVRYRAGLGLVPAVRQPVRLLAGSARRRW